MKTMLAIGDWVQCVPLITSATGNGWRVLHTTHVQEIPSVLERTPLELIALIGCLSPEEWERAAPLLWKAARIVPFLTCGSDTHQELLFHVLAAHAAPLRNADSSAVPRSPARSAFRETALRQSSLSQTLTLFEPHDTGMPSGIQIALDYIAARYSEPLTLDDAARAACYSRCHFCRVFKESLGVSFVAYLSELRIQQAVELLLHSHCAITDIAFAVGFNDLSHFERVFRTHLKQTPTQFRQQSKHPPQVRQLMPSATVQPVLS